MDEISFGDEITFGDEIPSPIKDKTPSPIQEQPVMEETKSADSYPIETDKIPLIFKNKIYEIKDVHKLEIYFYDLKGKLLISSKASFLKDTTHSSMSNKALEGLKISSEKHFIEKYKENGLDFQSSFTYIYDSHFKPIAILNLPYIENDDFLSRELKEYLVKLGVAYLFMLLIAIA